jgi:hypothetical protein
MDGKHFGVGLAAGLLVGLLVVTATSGFTFGLFGTFSASSYPEAGLVTYTTTTVASTTTQLVPSQNEIQSNKSLSSVTGSSTTPGANFGTTSTPFTPTAGVIISSRLDSIAKQPIAANVFLFVPVLIAFLLGAAIYLISRRGKEGADEQTLPGRDA